MISGPLGRRTHDALGVKDRGGALDQLHEIRCAGLGVSFFVGRGFDNMDEVFYVFWRRRLLWYLHLNSYILRILLISLTRNKG